jgi:hypothetical protein
MLVVLWAGAPLAAAARIKNETTNKKAATTAPLVRLPPRGTDATPLLSSLARRLFGPASARRRLGFGAATATLLAASCLLARGGAGSARSAAFAAAGYGSSPPLRRDGKHQGRRMVSASATSRSADGTVTVSPRDEASQSALVVFCHGLGDTSEGFADVAEVRIAVQKEKGRRNERRRYQKSPSGSLASRFY